MKKLTVNTANLLTALQTANKVLSKNMVLPILEGFKFEVIAGPGGAICSIVGTDLENSIKVDFPCIASENFAFTLSAAEIKFFEKLEGENTELTAFGVTEKDKKGIECISGYYVTINSLKDRAKLTTENPADFPKIELWKDGTHLVAWLNNDFQTELKTLLNYVGKDNLRPGMTGVFFETLSTGYNLTATDANMLRTNTLTGETLYNGTLNSENTINRILNPKFCKLVAGFSKVKEITLAIQENNTLAQFQHENLTVTIAGRCIDANYPDYTAVIPQNNPINLTAPIAPVLKLINKAQMFSNKTTWQGIFSINGDIKISAQDLDFNKEYTGQTAHIQHTGADIEIGFNLKFMEKALKDVTGENFYLELSTPTRAGVLKENNAVTLLMPVMLND